MTTITMPRRLMRPISTRPARRGVLIGFLGTLLAGAVLFVGLSVGLMLATRGTVLAGVTTGGISLAGLERAEAVERLADRLPSLSDGTATLTAGQLTREVAFSDLGRGYELEGMVDRALAVGRSGNPLADGLAHLRALVHPTTLPVTVHAYDDGAMERVAAEVAAGLSREPVDATVARDGTTFAVSASRPGKVVEPEAVRAALAAVAETTDPSNVTLRLSPATQAPAVNTGAARAAAAEATEISATLELTIPGAPEDEQPIELSAATIAEWLSFGPTAGEPLDVEVDEAAALAAVEALVEDVDQEPVNARFSVAGSGLGGVIAGQDGRALDVQESVAALLTALEQRGEGRAVPSLALAVDVTEPSLSTATATELLPRMQMVSSWTTNYVPGDGNGFGANISIPAWDLDGYNLLPGEWFSFWGGIGPINVERGYRYGGAIINGRSVAQGALAGGICSTSTTLFNAAMRFGLEIGERENHYYYIDRYPTGLDATVAIVDESVTDMTFRNDTEFPIVIRGYGSPGQVTFQVWSVPNGRTVALSDPYVTNHRAAIETTQVDASLAPGTSRRVEYPHNGFDASVSRTVYGPDGNVIHQNTWFSDYRAVNGITLVGPAAAAAEPPPAEGGETAGGVGDAPPEGGEEQP